MLASGCNEPPRIRVFTHTRLDALRLVTNTNLPRKLRNAPVNDTHELAQVGDFRTIIG